MYLTIQKSAYRANTAALSVQCFKWIVGLWIRLNWFILMLILFTTKLYSVFLTCTHKMVLFLLPPSMLPSVSLLPPLGNHIQGTFQNCFTLALEHSLIQSCNTFTLKVKITPDTHSEQAQERTARGSFRSYSRFKNTLLRTISAAMTATVSYQESAINLIRMWCHFCPHICHNIMQQTCNWFSIYGITEIDFHVCFNPSRPSIFLWDCYGCVYRRWW